MSENPKVSIIIPAYNAAKFLPETLESALSQTFQNTETIVVNDGSTDDTESVLRPYRHRIVYLAKPNKGVSSALNAGLERARGNYIAILDADDIWEKDKLQVQVHLMAKYSNVGVCYTDFVPFGEPINYRTGFEENDCALIRYARKQVDTEAYLITSNSLLADLLLIQGMPKPSSIMIRRSCFERVGVFDETLTFCQDTQMTLRMAKFFQFAYIDRCLMRRRIHSQSLASTQSSRAYVAEHIRMFQTLSDYIALNKEEQGAKNRVLAAYYDDAGYLEFTGKNIAFSRNLYLKSFRLKPSVRSLAYLLATLLPEGAIDTVRVLKQRLGSHRVNGVSVKDTTRSF